MIKQIRTSKFTKIVACYLAIMMFVEMTQPLRMYALTGGPSQPEFNSFTPISTSDMVDLSSGDFNYNIPIMDVGGYPLNLAYNSGVSMDQEASWVGLGWDLGVGQINRQMRGLPDDFNGDKMIYENNLKTNTTIGGAVNVFISPFGVGEKLKASVGVGLKYNNYDGFGASLTGGLTYEISDNMSVGMNLESSSTDGVSVSPSVSLSSKANINDNTNNMGLSLGVSMNSRKGVESVTMSANSCKKTPVAGKKDKTENSASMSGELSLNDASFTPTKRVGMSSLNTMFSLNLEGAIIGIDPGIKFSGYRTSQGIKSSEKYKVEKGYGYENTYAATSSDVLDFNREKDRTVTKNTVSLPVTNYTFDLYTIQGQGVSGSFRPYRSQVGYVYDNYTRDDSFGTTLGGEVGVGDTFHWGFDAAATISESSSGVWTRNNSALSRFVEKKTGNLPNYEKVFFKNIGGFHVDQEMGIFNDELGGYSPVTFKVKGDKFHRGIGSLYYDKYLINSKPLGNDDSFIKRDRYRLSRNQSIQKLTRLEASRYGFKTKFSRYCKRGINNNHTAEIRILKEGGEHYIYGRALYNVVKKEATFDVGTIPHVDAKNGFVTYTPGVENSKNNDGSKGDQYFNRVTTPAYAHTYLLTAVLSPDYEDLTGDGPTDDDLGTYTKFTHTQNKNGLYKWRVPFTKNKANYDEGLRSLKKDNKGNYQYGEKELLYIQKIETKTHVAIFTLSARKDGHGVVGENGGKDDSNPDSSKMWKLDKISLYSKPEYLLHKTNLSEATPIKEAHFVYDYSLCKGVENNFGERAEGTELNNQGGKLTLKKVYFTYRNSNMGRYTPYTFNYDTLNSQGNVVNDNNFNYDQKGYDCWGNYKPVNPGVGDGTTDALSNAEYPFVDQSDKAKADLYASSWLLKSIDLPSGGRMELQYESDDYQYVQDRKVMEMFKVVGAGDGTGTDLNSSNRYCHFKGSPYIYVRLEKPLNGSNDNEKSLDFQRRYLKKLGQKDQQPLYFRFLMNMAKSDLNDHDKYDYVTGYLSHLDEHDESRTRAFEVGGVQYAAIKVPDEDIQTAGIFFGRQYLNNIVYSLTGEEDVNNIKGVVLSIVNLIPQLVTIFQSPDENLKSLGIATSFVKDKSWIRLMQPDSKKFGGGSRVKEIKIHDRWGVMTNNTGDALYEQAYGQQYTYTKEEDGSSSGVATYEPLGNKENPFVEPFYDKTKTRVLLAPDTKNYVEMPFGECFYPAPKVTYSRVTVNNLARKLEGDALHPASNLTKHATGKVVTEFYTSYDYPTISDITKIDPRYDKSDLGAILNINVKTHLTMSQGFSIHTNDMDGKMKSQWVYAEGQHDAISGMEYKYEEKQIPTGLINSNEGKLNNIVTTVNSKGEISKKLVGVDYDAINDFRENNSITDTPGIHFNTEGFALAIIFIVVPVPIPSFSHHENILRTATTTKVIHSCGILSEKIAYDAGSKVSTKNLAWDADSGEVILTETVNEYNDLYYSFNFPAYWSYDGMSQAALNLGLEWKIENIGDGVGNQYRLDNDSSDLLKESDYLIDGDEVYVTWGDKRFLPIDKKGFKAWVVNVKGDKFDLIDRAGLKVDKFQFLNMKVVRSGHRNMQTASMASVTLMRNPLTTDGKPITTNSDPFALGNLRPHLYDQVGGAPFLTFNTTGSTNLDPYRVVNASAVEYKNQWASQCECGLPKMKYKKDGNEMVFAFEYDNTNEAEIHDDIDVIQARSYNPYLYNILGDWRAVKSYAYLTGRNKTDNPTPRKSGFFKDFVPFYEYSASTGKWKKTNANADRWTFASEVDQYSPYGQEVENKDALNRYSSALYGYNNRFPTAVASNTKYKELASDGFEDYAASTCVTKSHFSYQDALRPNFVSISNIYSHTGKSSLRIAPDTIAKIKKKVVVCAVKEDVVTPDPQTSGPRPIHTPKPIPTVKAKISTKKISKK